MSWMSPFHALRQGVGVGIWLAPCVLVRVPVPERSSVNTVNWVCRAGDRAKVLAHVRGATVLVLPTHSPTPASMGRAHH